MIQVEFYNRQEITKIQSNLYDKFEDVINKYIQKTSVDPSYIYFISNGRQIDPELTIDNHIIKETRTLKVFVYQIKEEKYFIESKDIICPICKELCRIKFDNFSIMLYDCNKNNHTIKKIKFKDFLDLQNINISDIICEKCKKNKMVNSHDKEFYKCLTCNNNLCVQCKEKHKKNHCIINYESKDFLCQKHHEFISNFCLTCKTNICSLCTKQHKEHNIMPINDIERNNIFETRDKLLEIKNEIKIFNNKLKEIIQKLNELIDAMNTYDKINDIIFNSFIKRNPYYQIYQNLKEINLDNEIFKSINKINKLTDDKDKLVNIMDFYNNLYPKNSEDINTIQCVKEKNKFNQMTILYEIKTNMEKIRLFGKKFVKNNKDNCYLLIDGKRNELIEQFKLNDKQRNQNIMEIKLVEIENKSINNLDYMFFNCSCLKALPDISNWNLKNVTSIYAMFYNCISLMSLPDITKFDQDKLFDMNWRIYGCNSLECLLHINKWDTKEATNIDSSFFDSNLISKLEDISECDNNIVYKSDEDDNDIEIEEDKNSNDDDDDSGESESPKFKGKHKCRHKCKLNTSGITDMSYMFHGCTSLKTTPDFSKWNLRNVKNVTGMFNGCTSLKSLPNMSKWNLSKKIKKDSMFEGCNEKLTKKLKNC